MSDAFSQPGRADKKSSSESKAADPLRLLDQLFTLTPPDDARYRILSALRKKVIEESMTLDQCQKEIAKLNGVIEKVTAPANRIGTLLGFPDPNFAHIVVGGAEYYARTDPRIEENSLFIGSRVLVNEAFAVIKSIGYEPAGSVLKIKEILPDGRIRAFQENGTSAVILIRSSRLSEAPLRAGDEVRADGNLRVAIEKVESGGKKAYTLKETPKVTWNDIGGQEEAVQAIRNAIERPLLYPELFSRYQFSPPKGFLLYGPPGCGKTLIGKATAHSLAMKLREKEKTDVEEFFLHLKGPEILNMWLGESERMVRELFEKAREKKSEGFLPFLFIDEAESILGTRRSGHYQNIISTLVPMFCAEMDGIESLRDTVVILASNRPDLIDPAILRPGRIDRKIKVRRPDRAAAEEIFAIYLNRDIPIAGSSGDVDRRELIRTAVDALFDRGPSQEILELQLRSGKRELLYQADLVSGALIASIIQRAKEKAIQRSIGGGAEGIIPDDLLSSIADEFREGEILPPNEIVEDWLKLLDTAPENVVSISARRGKPPLQRDNRVI